MDRLDMLRTFIAVADKASFAEAARHLNMSPTTATRGVNALEEALGVTLFHRTTRSVRLTDQGATYLERCRSALGDLDAANEEARGGAAAPRGSLVITAPLAFGRIHILPIVERLLAKYPELVVKLTLIDRVVRMVEEGIDIAVRIADLSDSALHAVRVAQVTRVLTASPGYLNDRGAPASPTDLYDHSIILFEALAGPNNEWRFGPAGKPAIRITPRLTVNTADAAIAAAKNGVGIVRTLSYQVAADVATGDLIRLLAEAEPPPVPVNLVFQGSRRNSPNIRAFIDEAKAYFSSATV